MTLPETFTSEEEDAIEELRTRMKGSLTPKLLEEDTIFYRFLKARDFDVNKAENMLQKHITWRKANQIDTILEDMKPKEVYIKHLEPNILGYDKEGDVIIYSPIGKLDTRECLKAIKFNVLMMNIVRFQEKVAATMKEYTKKTGRKSNQVVLIFDMEELTLSNAMYKLSLEILLRFTHITQDNYPEGLKAIYFINAPSYYMFAFSVLKSIMSKHMLRKIKPFGNTGWKEHLLEAIDADVLPKFLGGNRTDPDGNPKCNTFVKHGGKVPPIYYLSTNDRYFPDTHGVKKAFIPPLEKKKIYIDVTENDSRIHWRFYVKGKDIGFGLFLYVSEQDVKELIPIMKFSTTDGTEEGYYRCHSTGTYIATFDNSYSWLTSKEVEYQVMITNGD